VATDIVKFNIQLHYLIPSLPCSYRCLICKTLDVAWTWTSYFETLQWIW